MRMNKPDIPLVFKAEYGPHLKALSIKVQCRKLYYNLQQLYGQPFLQDVRTIIAHPVRTNMFLKFYHMSFAP